MSNRQFVFLIACTFVVVIIWIIADILHTRPSVPPNPQLTTILAPINPNFDQKVLDQVKDTDALNQFSLDEKVPNPSNEPDLAKQPVGTDSAAINQPVPTPLPAVDNSLNTPFATSGGTTP